MKPPPWQDDARLRRLIDAISDAGGTARLVGGCVRDWLYGRKVGDLDLATDLVPDQVTDALLAADFKVIPTGVDHGTVTAVHEGQSFEITTLRHDLQTNGRHATVGFTSDWSEDARRRDFTVNAMYADFDGTLHDPTGLGRRDLSDRMLRFVGEPEERIREDYLRILRFHRFASQIGFQQDEGGLAACARLYEGLKQLSAERIWQEMRRLLAGEHRSAVLARMAQDGTLAVILPEATLSGWQERLPSQDALLMLAAMTEKDAASVARRWKLSKAEAGRLEAATRGSGGESALQIHELRRLAWYEGVRAAKDRMTIDAARSGADCASNIMLLQRWIEPVFPVSGRDVLDQGFSAGPHVGDLLRQVEKWWVERDFEPDRDTCLKELRRRTGQS